MKCYFCQVELPQHPDYGKQSGIKHDICWDKCNTCHLEHNVNTYTSVDKDGRLMYAHIYVDNRKFISMPAPSPIGFPVIVSSIAVGNNYHYRLHLQEGFTNLANPDDCYSNDWVIIPGFPITPANAREKLKRYIASIRCTEIHEL